MSSSSPSTPPVFAYGTLQSPLVLSALLPPCPPPPLLPAILPNFSRHPIHSQCYPAILPSPSSSSSSSSSSSPVHGRLLLNLTPAQLALLDAVEHPSYLRLLLPVHPLHPAHSPPLLARVYARSPHDHADLDLTRDWDYPHFYRHHERWYGARCAAWARDYAESLTAVPAAGITQ